MTQEVATQSPGALSAKAFSREQIDLLKRTIAKDHTDDELQLFLAYCKSRGLDPFAREVYSIKRGAKVTIQTGIDGFRKRAEETGEYDGHETYWCGPDGQWVDVWLAKEPPAAAKVVTYRRGAAKPFIGIAKWSEYKPQDNDFIWVKMPANQLAKCAEALALRIAFPGKLGGLYSSDEMAQAKKIDEPIATPQAIDTELMDEPVDLFDAPSPTSSAPTAGAGQRLSPKQQAFLFGLAKKKGWDENDVKAYCQKFFNKPDPTTLTSPQLDTVLQQLKTLGDASPSK